MILQMDSGILQFRTLHLLPVQFLITYALTERVRSAVSLLVVLLQIMVTFFKVYYQRLLLFVRGGRAALC